MPFLETQEGVLPVAKTQEKENRRWGRQTFIVA